MEQIKWVKNTMPKTDDRQLAVMGLDHIKKHAHSTRASRSMRSRRWPI